MKWIAWLAGIAGMIGALLGQFFFKAPAEEIAVVLLWALINITIYYHADNN